MDKQTKQALIYLAQKIDSMAVGSRLKNEANIVNNCKCRCHSDQDAMFSNCVGICCGNMLNYSETQVKRILEGGDDGRT